MIAMAKAGGGHVPGVRGAAVGKLLDGLDLDEVVASADGSDLRITPIARAGSLDERVERERARGRQRAGEMDALEIKRLARAVVVAPEPGVRVVGGRVEEAPRAPRGSGLALARRHGDVAAATEEDRPEPVLRRASRCGAGSSSLTSARSKRDATTDVVPTAAGTTKPRACRHGAHLGCPDPLWKSGVITMESRCPQASPQKRATAPFRCLFQMTSSVSAIDANARACAMPCGRSRRRVARAG